MSREPPDTSATAAYRPERLERRKHRRFATQWRLRISGITPQTVLARTVDVSSGGFYCYSSRAFLPGDRLTVLLDIPNGLRDQDSEPIVLRCDVRVLRAEVTRGDLGWGMACQILDYSVLRVSNTEINAAASVDNLETD